LALIAEFNLFAPHTPHLTPTMLSKVIRNLWKLFLFSFPFSLNLILYEKRSYSFGNFNPWVTGFLYLPEVLLILIFLLWLIEKVRAKKFGDLGKAGVGTIFLLLFVINAGIISFFLGNSTLFLFYVLRIAEAGMIYLILRDEVIPHYLTVTWLLYGALFQIVIAFLQTRINQSVGLSFIGEPYINPDTANVAKIDLADGTKQIRAYGTFLHPNILGAYLMTILFIALPYLKKASLTFWLVILTGGIFLTGSQAAQMTTVTVFAILFILSLLKKAHHKRTFTLGLLVVLIVGNAWFFVNSSRVNITDTSIKERLTQNVISLDMALNNFSGVGVGNFTLEMEKYSPEKLMPWEFQPVHNAYFLTLNETGIQGFLILLVMMTIVIHAYWKTDVSYSLRAKARILPLIALIIIASFDHLLITSYIGPWLIALVLNETSVKV